MCHCVGASTKSMRKGAQMDDQTRSDILSGRDVI